MGELPCAQCTFAKWVEGRSFPDVASLCLASETLRNTAERERDASEPEAKRGRCPRRTLILPNIPWGRCHAGIRYSRAAKFDERIINCLHTQLLQSADSETSQKTGAIWDDFVCLIAAIMQDLLYVLRRC